MRNSGWRSHFQRTAKAEVSRRIVANIHHGKACERRVFDKPNTEMSDIDGFVNIDMKTSAPAGFAFVKKGADAFDCLIGFPTRNQRCDGVINRCLIDLWP